MLLSSVALQQVIRGTLQWKLPAPMGAEGVQLWCTLKMVRQLTQIYSGLVPWVHSGMEIWRKVWPTRAPGDWVWSSHPVIQQPPNNGKFHPDAPLLSRSSWGMILLCWTLCLLREWAEIAAVCRGDLVWVHYVLVTDHANGKRFCFCFSDCVPPIKWRESNSNFLRSTGLQRHLSACLHLSFFTI